jgi:hypothetical protein
MRLKIVDIKKNKFIIIIEMDYNNERVWLASFDIGKLTFTFYIEEIDVIHMKKIENIDKINRYNNDGTCQKNFSILLENVFKNGKNIVLETFNLTEGCDDPKKYYDKDYCYNMFDVLDQYSEYWKKVTYFIVEKQMSFGKRNNTMALKIGQSCQSYFMINYGKDISIIDFPAYYKTIILGAPQTLVKTKKGYRYKTLGDRERKKWSVKEGIYILSLRDDFETMSQIGGMKKQDDVSDVIVQLQAFKYLFFVDNLKF